MNRRFPLLALAPLLVLPSCSAFKLSDNKGLSPRTFGRFSVAEGRGLALSPEVTLKPVTAPQTVAATPAPVVTPPAPVVASTVEKVQTAPAPEPVKPADRPAVQKKHSEQDADQLRLPGDLLNQLPGEKDYKPSTGGNNDAPVIAKPPGSR